MANVKSAQRDPNVVPISGSDAAPIVFFDGCIAYGTNAGIVQLELAMDQMVPNGEGVKHKAVVTAHLRCSERAAVDLFNVLQKMMSKPQGAVAS